MKHLLENVNNLARAWYVASIESEKLRREADQLERELQQKQIQLESLKRDQENVERSVQKRLQCWEDELRVLKETFSKQERFKGAPSEEINRAFSEEVLPDLDDVG